MLLPFLCSKLNMRNAWQYNWKTDPNKILKSKKKMKSLKDAVAQHWREFNQNYIIADNEYSKRLNTELANLFKDEGVFYNTGTKTLTDPSVEAKNAAILNPTAYAKPTTKALYKQYDDEFLAGGRDYYFLDRNNRPSTAAETWGARRQFAPTRTPYTNRQALIQASHAPLPTQPTQPFPTQPTFPSQSAVVPLNSFAQQQALAAQQQAMMQGQSPASGFQQPP